MSNELVSILLGLPTIGIALIAVILTSMYRMETRLREDMKQSEGRLREDVKQLADRVGRLEHGQAKLEGLLEGLREAISGRVASG